jgi:hypothetical protein
MAAAVRHEFVGRREPVHTKLAGQSASAMLCRLFLDAIKAAPLDQLATYFDGREDGIPLGNRPALIARFDEELRGLELAEVALIAARADGVVIDRIGPVSPWAVLQLCFPPTAPQPKHWNELTVIRVRM